MSIFQQDLICTGCVFNARLAPKESLKLLSLRTQGQIILQSNTRKWPIGIAKAECWPWRLSCAQQRCGL